MIAIMHNVEMEYMIIQFPIEISFKGSFDSTGFFRYSIKSHMSLKTSFLRQVRCVENHLTIYI